MNKYLKCALIILFFLLFFTSIAAYLINTSFIVLHIKTRGLIFGRILTITLIIALSIYVCYKYSNKKILFTRSIKAFIFTCLIFNTSLIMPFFIPSSGDINHHPLTLLFLVISFPASSIAYQQTLLLNHLTWFLNITFWFLVFYLFLFGIGKFKNMANKRRIQHENQK